jgi:hypothetical protein
MARAIQGDCHVSRHGHNETLNFSGMSNYYGSIADGYGGFDWQDLDYLNQKGADGSQWSESGFPNTPHSWAILPGVEGHYQYDWGVIVSSDLSETFSLRSMLAASAGQTNEQIYLRSYTYGAQGFALKASDAITLSPTAERIDFAKLGNGDDFKNISAIVISDYIGSGWYGGHDRGVPTYVLKFTDFKVHWNGSIPNGFQAGAGHPGLSGAHHVIAAHLAASDAESNIGPHNVTDAVTAAYHSAIASLDVALGPTGPGDGLTSQFALPQIQHFGP